MNNPGLFLKEKTEKVVSAIYMVTSFLPEQDGIRSHLRQQGNALVTKVTDVFLGGRESITQARSLVVEIESFLSVAVHAQIVSAMNGNIVRKELGRIKDALDLITVDGTKPRILSENFFGIVEKSNTDNGEEIDKGHTESKSMSFINKKEKKPMNRAMSYKGHTPVQKTSFVSGDRKSKILAIIRDKREVSIKDISRTIHGVSEKTIQRDLIGLVEQGILRKKGERRWSTYLLV